MPPRPRTPRVSPSRRPRVAGLAPAAPRPDAPARPAALTDDPLSDPADATEAIPTTAVEEPTPSTPDPAGSDVSTQRVEGTDTPQRSAPTAGPAAARPEGPAPDDAPPVLNEARTAVPVRKKDHGTPNGAATRPRPRPRPAEPAARPGADDSVDDPAPLPSQDGEGLGAAVRGMAVPLLAAALVVLVGAAVFFGVQDARLRGTPAATNVALVDVGATAEASGQLSDAIETVYSFDFTRLDENRNAAREVITPAFAAQFENLFAEVQARAPEQQAVVSATVTMSAVKELTADRAVLVAFVDQQATRAAPDAESQQLAAAGRLTVTGEKVDGRWKIAAVTPL